MSPISFTFAAPSRHRTFQGNEKSSTIYSRITQAQPSLMRKISRRSLIENKKDETHFTSELVCTRKAKRNSLELYRSLVQNHAASVGTNIAWGSLMASFLLDEKSVENSFSRCYANARKRLKYITLDENALNGGFAEFMKRGLNHEFSTAHSPLDLSTAVEGDSVVIDYFVCHCWTDDVDEKIRALISFARKFKRDNGRYPRLWIDLFCVDQDPLYFQTNIELLPVFLMACDKVLLLKSNRLTSRLWCLMELYTRAAMTPLDQDPGSKIEVINLENYVRRDPPLLVDCKKAGCYEERDSLLLREKLSRCPGGLRRVNRLIRRAVKNAPVFEYENA